MAFGVIALDIILRLMIIEKTAAQRQLDVAESPVAASDIESSPRCVQVDGAAQGSDGPGEEVSRLRRWEERLPPVVTLLRHPRLLNSVWGTLIQASLTSSFETTVFVPLVLLVRGRWLTRGNSCRCMSGTRSDSGPPARGMSPPPLGIELVLICNSLVFIPLILPTFLSPVVGLRPLPPLHFHTL